MVNARNNGQTFQDHPIFRWLQIYIWNEKILWKLF